MSLRPGHWRHAFGAAATALLLAACGGGGGIADGAGGSPAPAPGAPVDAPVAVAAVRAGVSPFIAFVDLQLPAGDPAPATVHWRIVPRPGSVSQPVDVRYAMAYLQRRGYADAGVGRVTVPVFGLYANHLNEVDVELQYGDGSTKTVRAPVQSAPYVDPNGIFDRASILKPRAAGEALGFDFFAMKSAVGSPVIVDSDGQVRWVAPGPANSTSSVFQDNGFVIGDATGPGLLRLELDGTATPFTVQVPGATRFHHNIDPGKQGVLVEVDARVNGVENFESIVADVDPATGAVLQQWNLGDTLARHMLARGDDPSPFVRPGVDWFHMNAATYDPRDDTLIVSSRENFVVKIDYATGDLVWILGDPTKYWHAFPSLAASSLALPPGDLYPVGQHAVSIRTDGTLMLFNDGAGSFNQPAGQPAGETRTYSAVSAYAIDAASRTARETFRFDHGQTLLSAICSSAYESGTDASMLVTYAVADNGAHARLVALDESQRVVFDFEYPTTSCATSWNARPIGLGGLVFR